LLVLHRAPQPGKREREAVFFWRKPDGGWVSGQGGSFLSLREHIREYETAEIQLSQRYEQVANASDYFQILAQTAPLHHAARNLHSTLQAAREAIPQDHDLIDLRDWAYDLERNLDLLYTNTRSALDWHMARQTEEETRLSLQSIQAANRLNMLAAIFFPLTALSGLFGMNLREGLAMASSWIFWLVLLVGILIGLTLSQWALKGTRIAKQPQTCAAAR
jgi:Mg2+ and Co2+ transporter CorA